MDGLPMDEVTGGNPPAKGNDDAADRMV